MLRATQDCCILNQGTGAWAFELLASRLAQALGIPVSSEPRAFNYLLHWEPPPANDFLHPLFIPLPAIHRAADKRLSADAFLRHHVPTPRTILVETFAEVREFVARHSGLEWCLKFPIGCGAAGHRFVTVDSTEPRNWPRPYLVQEFIRLERPEVFRLYGAGGQYFGWVARRFPAGQSSSPWVAHARGARYEILGDAPDEALAAGRAALEAAGLTSSFGCADLLRRPSGEWLVLEVGTDGLFNHVDRDLDNPEFEAEIHRQIARAFWQRAHHHFATASSTHPVS